MIVLPYQQADFIELRAIIVRCYGSQAQVGRAVGKVVEDEDASKFVSTSS